jgi:hypothetical protein
VGKLTKKQIRKRVDKKCYFCPEDNYDLLDCHRIIPGQVGGKYTDFNMMTTCCKCHRKIHAGIIKILGKYFTSGARYVVNYIEDGEEKWK